MFVLPTGPRSDIVHLVYNSFLLVNEHVEPQTQSGAGVGQYASMDQRTENRETALS